MTDVVNAAAASDPDPGAPDKPLGPINAALIAAGVGCTAVGLFTSLAEASKAAKDFMTLSKPVGPLSGKIVLALVVWLIAWAVLHFALRKAAMSFKTAFTITLVLIVVGLLGTFPLVFQALEQ